MKLNAVLEDFRNLNWKDPGSWPAIPKIGLLLLWLAVVLAGGGWYEQSTQIEELNRLHEEEAKLKEDYKIKKAKAINLEAFEDQLKKIQLSFGELLKQLPDSEQMPALLVDINQAGLGRGLQFELFRPAEHETAKGFIAELPISLKIVGGYHDLAYFAGDVARLSRIVTLSDISLTVQPKDQSLMLETVAKTFRYLDEEELARQKAAAKAKDKKPGAK